MIGPFENNPRERKPSPEVSWVPPTRKKSLLLTEPAKTKMFGFEFFLKWRVQDGKSWSIEKTDIGDQLGLGINVYGMEDRYEFTAPVNYYAAGASPFGALNMAGNVWEWCLDWYDKDYYRISPELDPEGPEAKQVKVLRGGSWINDIDGVQVTQRARNLPETQNKIYGFRTVLPLR